MSRPSRSVLNSLFTMVESMTGPVLFLLTTPLFIHRLGVDHFGLWIMASALTGFSGLLTFGAGEATTKFVSAALARSDPLEVVHVIRSTLTFSAVMGFATALVIGGLAPVLVHFVFHVAGGDQHIAVEVLRLAGLGLALRFLDGILVAIFQGHQRYDLSSRIGIVTTSIGVLISVLLVEHQFGIVAVILASTLMVMVQLAVRSLVLRYRLLGDWTFLIPSGRRMLVGGLLEFSLLSWLQSLSSILLNQLDRFLVLSFLGLHCLAIYGTCLQACQLVHMIPSRMLAFSFPKFSELAARDDRDGLERVYKKGMIVSASTAAALAGPLVVLAYPLFRGWVGPSIAAEITPIAAPLATIFALYATTIMPYYILTGSRFMRLSTASALSGSVLVALSTFLAVLQNSLPGVAWSKVAALPTSILSRIILYRLVFRKPLSAALIIDSVPMLSGLALMWMMRLLGGPTHDWPLAVCLVASLGLVIVLGSGVWTCATALNGMTLRLEDRR